VELQLPLFRRILAQNPRVSIHLWNLARENSDDQYLKALSEPGIEIHHQFSGPRAMSRIPRVWQHYSMPRFCEHIFVKIDDDVVFLQTDRLADFVAAVQSRPGAIVSALTVNNGASTRLMPRLWEQFETLGIPLLDVHMSNAFAEKAHNYMFEHWSELIDTPLELTDCEDWCSINCIGLDWPTLARLTNRLGHAHPRFVAGREWHPRHRIGDEGSANMESRHILQGFLAAHLGFGPQQLTGKQEALWRHSYGEIGLKYLAARVAAQL
jgi:hypothetical protein